MASSKRDQLLSTALALFYREGYHSTGIDRILAESGVAKMTLYKHFKSKDELILAALQMQHEQISQRMRQALDGLAPREAILRAYDGLHLWLGETGFCGCLFLHAAAEFHDRSNPIHRQAAEHKRFVLSHFHAALLALGAVQAEQLAAQLQFLFEGAMSMAHLYGPAEQALQAKAAADRLLAAAGI
ncbi:TetR/AcrR family transcriptional regulator [Pseudomonas sp. UBA2684]|uniref:TetR/AcrR family transcriptional regulator n=1 Tax=Pseudomonas sp. UBA2684 TaxID=1947311 RepID=UPI000E9AF75D|nr:TetR/AcrR family transcriptional regulator [Pseudomonas sp. UBA2684]HBX57693.1 TetR family transcriptional regulator [Pseudomonas sp.]